MEENKKLICFMLSQLLCCTNAGADVVTIDYNEKYELATIGYKNGERRVVNVACDSGIAMIRDICKHF